MVQGYGSQRQKGLRSKNGWWPLLRGLPRSQFPGMPAELLVAAGNDAIEH